MGQIVVGYDGTDKGRVALDKGLELAHDLGDGVVIVFGYAPPGLWGGEIADHEEAIEELGEKAMEEARERAKTEEVPCEEALIAKSGADALLEVAEERDARLIVVGSHGDTPIKEAILGSTPYRLVQASHRPILVVPTAGER